MDPVLQPRILVSTAIRVPAQGLKDGCSEALLAAFMAPSGSGMTCYSRVSPLLAAAPAFFAGMSLAVVMGISLGLAYAPW